MSWATAFRRLGHRLGSVDLSCRDFLSWELVNSSMNRTIFSARSVLQLKLNLRRADLVLTNGEVAELGTATGRACNSGSESTINAKRMKRTAAANFDAVFTSQAGAEIS
ncbi:hypothetical protein ACTGJ9_038930 [Bradyrhizobium sp. RDM12]